jgi:predicted nucleic acid-binding protein
MARAFGSGDITPITWPEVVGSARGKTQRAESEHLLAQFALAYLTPEDQHWAMEQFARFQFSHHIDMNDCLIASVAARLSVPLYIRNLKDRQPLLGDFAHQSYG